MDVEGCNEEVIDTRFGCSCGIHSIYAYICGGLPS
jgi:hypothetical protein